MPPKEDHDESTIAQPQRIGASAADTSTTAAYGCTRSCWHPLLCFADSPAQQRIPFADGLRKRPRQASVWWRWRYGAGGCPDGVDCGVAVAVGRTVAVGSSVAVGQVVAVGCAVVVGRAVDVGMFVAAGLAVCRAGCAGTGGSAESDEGGELPGNHPLAAATSRTSASAMTATNAPIPAPSPSARRSRSVVTAARLAAN